MEKPESRDNAWRKVQDKLSFLVPVAVLGLWSSGFLRKTELGRKIWQGEKYSANDITLMGLEITLRSARQILKTGLPNLEYWVVQATDVLDGAYARRTKTASPEGAVFDAVCDRIGDLEMAKMIGQEKLYKAFLLSTLLKATCEMTGAIISEGGGGGMPQRRQELYAVLEDFGQLRNWPLGKKGRKARLEDINRRTGLLLKESEDRAEERLKAIGSKKLKIDNPESAGAVEARKYAAVVILVKKKYGVDMVEELNKLGGKFEFPTPDELVEKYKYIKGSLEAVQEFVDRAVSLTGA